MLTWFWRAESERIADILLETKTVGYVVNYKATSVQSAGSRAGVGAFLV